MVVDDEESLLEAIRYALSREGMEVVTAADGTQAVRDFERERPDLLVLDLMLPGLSGWDVCRRVRASSQIPILMLTARDAEVDRVVGLEMGADDYVTKPFSLRELVARVRALLRRAGQAQAPTDASVIEAAGIRLDQERHEVTVRGDAVSLPLKEFELLEILMENRPGPPIHRGANARLCLARVAPWWASLLSPPDRRFTGGLTLGSAWPAWPRGGPRS